jgi:SAM-dependent methyltransferase
VLLSEISAIVVHPAYDHSDWTKFGNSALFNLFDAIASHYSAFIAPFMLPLARDLADQLPATFQTALDVGTGTGILARCLPAARVIGIDTSAAMLRYTPADNIAYIQADIQKASFADQSFDLVAASFGLNANYPRRTFRSISRLLRPGGTLILQEWGAMDDAVFAVQTVLEEFTPPELVDALDNYAAPFEVWHDMLQTPDDYAELLREIVFTDVHADESAPVAIPTTRAAFLRYQLAWANAQTIIAAQDKPEFLYDALHHALPETFDWRPNLIRVLARKSK